MLAHGSGSEGRCDANESDREGWTCVMESTGHEGDAKAVNELEDKDIGDIVAENTIYIEE